MNARSSFHVDALLMLVAAIWGINPTIMKIAMYYMPPMACNTSRILMALAATWVVFIVSGTYKKVEKVDYPHILISAAGFSLFQYLFTVGVNITTSGNAALTMTMLPAFVAVINRIRRTEKITLQTVAGIFVSFIGIVVIIIASGKRVDFGHDSLMGMLMLIAAQISFAVFMVYSKDAVNKYSNYQIITYVITASIIVFIIPTSGEMLSVDWSELPLSAWLSLLGSGVLGMCGGNFLWAWGIKRIGSTKTALYNNLPPLFAVVTGYYLLGEIFSLMQLSGAAVVFLGLYVTRTAREFHPILAKEI